MSAEYLSEQYKPQAKLIELVETRFEKKLVETKLDLKDFVNEKIEQLERKLETRFEKIEARFEKIELRIQKLEEKVEALHIKFEEKFSSHLKWMIALWLSQMIALIGILLKH